MFRREKPTHLVNPGEQLRSRLVEPSAALEQLLRVLESRKPASARGTHQFVGYVRDKLNSVKVRRRMTDSREISANLCTIRKSLKHKIVSCDKFNLF